MGIKKNLKWALVLSGGGAKGIAHAGVLNVLEERGYPPPSLIAGTSMGAIVGGLYACGMTPKELTRFIMEDFNITQYLDSFVFKISGPVGRFFQAGQILGSLATRPGIDSGQRIFELLERLTGGKTFEEAAIPFRCNAVDLVEGREVVFKTGSVARAMRASMSFPGFFDPLAEGNMRLVDGGLADNMPVSIARDEGFKRVLAVNVDSFNSLAAEELTNGPQIVFRTIETALALKNKKAGPKPNLLIHVTDATPPFAFFRKKELIELGERAVRENQKIVDAFFGRFSGASFPRKRYRECGIREDR